ncbi:MAG: hypothetical protein HY721_21775 [Planctomycetes bacterium]|nr:hypothetical protein [Planctomycetota bacterium]
MIDTAAVPVFVQGRPSHGEIVSFCSATEDEVFVPLGDSGNTAADATVIPVPRLWQPAFRTMWRGRRILSEAELAKVDFPYPPEPEWESGPK